MICPCCQVAASFPDYNQFSPNCQYCSARSIHRLKAFQLGVTAYRERRDKILAEGIRYDVTSEAVMGLLKAGTLIGPAMDTVSVSPAPVKRRSVGKK